MLARTIFLGILFALFAVLPSSAQTQPPVQLAQALSPEQANQRGDDAYDRKDYAEAMRFYRQAADQGYALGEANIGYLYSHGYGVPVDQKEAVHWYLMAAQKGQIEAQYNLGLHYEKGSGVAQDMTQARYWIQKAAVGGDQKAQQWLQEH